MFFRKRKKSYAEMIMEINNSSPRHFDDSNIDSESIRITKDLDNRDDLYKIDDFFAYSNDEYLEILSNENDNIKGRVMPKSLKLRKDIGSDGEVIEILEHQEEVYIIKAFNGWYYVETLRGTSGWCMSCHIDADINGYDKENKAKERNARIEKILKDTENGLLRPTDEPTKLKSGFLSSLFKW